MRIRAIAVSCVLLAGCRQAETPQHVADRMRAEADSLRPMFDTAFAAYNREYNAANVEPLVTRYASDALIMPPNMGPLIGRDSMRALYVTAFAKGPNGIVDVKVERIVRNGPLVVVRARWTFVPAATNPMPADTGESVTVWSHGAEGWKIIQDIWHSDVPVRRP